MAQKIPAADTRSEALEDPTNATDPENNSGEQRLGDMLVKHEIVTEEQLQEALALKSVIGGFLGQAFIELKCLDQDTLSHFLVRQCHIPFINLSDYDIGVQHSELLTPEFCKHHRVLPIDKMGRILTIAMVNPLRDDTLQRVQESQPNVKVKAILCNWPDFNSAFKKLYTPDVPPEQVAAPARIEKTSVDAKEESVSSDRLDAESAHSTETVVANGLEVAPEEKTSNVNIISLETAKPIVALSAKGTSSSNEIRPDTVEELEQSHLVVQPLVSEQRFDTFQAGSGNTGTVELCKAFANAPARYGSTVTLVGPAGCGKTHLLNAIGHKLSESGLKVGVVTAAQLGRALILNPTSEEIARYSCLIIENLGNHLSEAEIQALAEWMDRRNAETIVGFSTQKILTESERLTSALASRCAGGLIVHCLASRGPVRKELLSKLAGKIQLELSDSVAQLLADKLPGDGRALQGALVRLAAECKIRGTQPDIEQVTKLIETLYPAQM